MWDIAQTNAQTLPVTKRKKIHGPKNVQIHNLTRSNTLLQIVSVLQISQIGNFQITGF